MIKEYYSYLRINQTSLFCNSYETVLFSDTRTGQVVQELLDYCMLKKEDIAITNLFKGILKKREYPLAKDYRNCLPLLKEQLEQLKPKKIVVFGVNGKKFLEDRIICYFSKHPSKILTD